MKSRPLTRREDGKSNWKKNKPTCAAVSHEATNRSRHALPYLSPRGGAAELRLQPGPPVRADSGCGGGCPSITGFAPVGSVPFPSIRFIVKLKPNEQSCVFRLSSGQINLGRGWGWIGVRVGKIAAVGGLWNVGGGVMRKTRNWPFCFIHRQNHCD